MLGVTFRLVPRSYELADCFAGSLNLVRSYMYINPSLLSLRRQVESLVYLDNSTPFPLSLSLKSSLSLEEALLALSIALNPLNS